MFLLWVCVWWGHSKNSQYFYYTQFYVVCILFVGRLNICDFFPHLSFFSFSMFCVCVRVCVVAKQPLKTHALTHKHGTQRNEHTRTQHSFTLSSQQHRYILPQMFGDNENTPLICEDGGGSRLRGGGGASRKSVRPVRWTTHTTNNKRGRERARAPMHSGAVARPQFHAALLPAEFAVCVCVFLYICVCVVCDGTERAKSLHIRKRGWRWGCWGLSVLMVRMVLCGPSDVCVFFFFFCWWL